jgi:Fur family peroxide stress response transcriptional regulator
LNEREIPKPDLEGYLRAGGLRPTAQRYSVLKYLTRRPVHATADEIFAALNRQFPLVSRATVYNALRDLTRAGLIRELASEGKAALFDANLHPHHHFVCDACGALEDIEWFEIPAQSRKAVTDGRSVRSYEVTFHGTCRRCSKSPEAQ